MPAYNFRTEFAAAVESGAKRQTIRAVRKDKRRPKVGEPFHAYTGLRNVEARCLHRGVTTRVRHARMDFEGRTLIVDGLRATREEALEIARADGFDSFETMLEWFWDVHGDADDVDGGFEFEGYIINWQ
jgi:hypothetical protein